MSQIKSILIFWESLYFPRANENHVFCWTYLSTFIDAFIKLAELVNKFDPCKVTGDPTADTRRSLVHPDLHIENIFVDPVSSKLLGIIDWAEAGIYPEWYSSVIPKCFRSPDLYCKQSPLKVYEEDLRERYMEITGLRAYYLLCKGF